MPHHVCIVGGGVIGLCTAHYAAARGHRVTILDRGGPARDGCSFGNAGMVVPSHVVPLAAPGMVAMGLRMMWHPESPFRIKPRLSWELFDWGLKFWRACNARHVARAGPVLRDLHLLSRRCYEELADGTDAAGGTNAAAPAAGFGLTKRGLLMLCKTEHGLAEAAAEAGAARRLGVPADVLDPAGLAALDPGATMDVVGGVHYPLDCHLSPARFMAALRARLEAAGATFRWRTDVAGWRTEPAAGGPGKVVAVRTTAGEEIEADQFVLAAGSWSAIAGRDLKLRIPLQAGKGYSLTLAGPRQRPQLCSILTEARVAVTPMGETVRFGGTMEVAGLDASISPRRVRGIVRSVPRYFPAFAEADFDGVAPWQGLRPVSPDGLPYLGRPRRWANLVVATGHAMMGLSLGPATGLLVARMLDGEPPEPDLSILSPDRYAA